MIDSSVKDFLVCVCVVIYFFNVTSSDNVEPVTVVQSYQNLKSLKYSSVNVNAAGSQVNSLLYKTANKYLCHYKKIENPEMLIYGTKSWTFPRQTVNLTLTYPTQAQVRIMQLHQETGPYIITGFDMILLVDTVDTRGFITSGGLLKDTIGLSFECNNVTTISYEFWVYGVPRDAPRVAEYSTDQPGHDRNDMCEPDD